MIESTKDISVESVEDLEIEATTDIAVSVEDSGDLSISISKKEYSIVGDEIYVPVLYDDAPQWMKDLVEVVVSTSIDTSNTALISQLNEVLSEFATSYVPLNQYTQSILDLSDEDTRLNGLIETLNSNFNDGLSDANAQIIDLQTTKASKDEVVASVISTISAQLADPASSIGATIGTLSQAIVDESNARTTSIETLTASMESESDNRASAIDTINAYVGIDEAGASTNTGLSAYLEASDGTIGGADSSVANLVYVDGTGTPRSKWEYGSVINIGGVNYTSGFGLKTDGANSEFWIDASRLKFTNSNQTGQVAPFTIDASGTTPEIEFNGKVSFGNIYDQTIIQNGYINTGLIETNTITSQHIRTSDLIAYNISATDINSKNITGSYISGAVIEGAVIRGSWIDLTSTKYLSLWKQATDIENSSSIYYAYRDNFAKEEDGTFVKTDDFTYYRLPASTTYNVVGSTIEYYGLTVFGDKIGTQNINDATFYGIDINSSSSYKVANSYRLIDSTVVGKFCDVYSGNPAELLHVYATNDNTGSLSQFKIYYWFFGVKLQFLVSYVRYSNATIEIRNASGTVLYTWVTSYNSGTTTLDLTPYCGSYGDIFFNLKSTRTKYDGGSEYGGLTPEAIDFYIECYSTASTQTTNTISGIAGSDNVKVGLNYVYFPPESRDKYRLYPVYPVHLEI